MYFIDKTNREKRAVDSRRSDYKEAERIAKTSNDPGARQTARKAMENFKKERYDGTKLSMRQSLINAHRQGNTEEVKDIQDYIKGKNKYHNE